VWRNPQGEAFSYNIDYGFRPHITRILAIDMWFFPPELADEYEQRWRMMDDLAAEDGSPAPWN
jgi:hypothetical protein